MLRAVDLLEAGHIHATPQDEAHVTWARKLEKADARLDWNLPARSLHNRVRGFHPWPGTCCEAPAGSRRLLKILRARVEPGAGAPGTVLETAGDGPLVACGEDAMRLLDVQPEGKRVMPGSDYVHGTRLAAGERLG